MSKEITDREIPEDHRLKLCTALSMTAVPPSVVDRYWRIKRCADKSNVFPSDEMLVLIAGWDAVKEEESTPPAPEVDWSAVPYDSAVKAWWRNKERDGRFQGVSPVGDLFVVVDGSPDVREIAPRKVTLLNEALV